MNCPILWDCHLHSSFSADSQTPLSQMARRAAELGLAGICVTEHLDPDYPKTPENLTFSLDLPAYRKVLTNLKEEYRGRLSIRFGIELGLQPHLSGRFHTLLAETGFDFVIGSSHIVHGFDPYYPDFFRGRAEKDCYREYFQSILENLQAFDKMDVYGHLDYVVRYGPRKNQDYRFADHRDILEEILRTLVSKGIGLELNTGGYHYGLGQPNPCQEILTRYRELGGELVTVGADAHAPDKIAFAFDKAAEVLRLCGFDYYCVFENRKPVFYKL